MNPIPTSTLEEIVRVADLTADGLTEASRKAAAAMLRRVAIWRTQATPEAVIHRQARGMARRHHIELPNKEGLQQVLNRLCDPAWWRRALRKRFRHVELLAIRRGEVHANAAQYVSDKTMARAVRNQRRIAELLESLVAVNQSTGEMLPLDELALSSLSNPANRRSAMMVRVKGTEQHCMAKGQVALFFTLTCPSRMHARHIKGATNARYDGTSPRQAQAHLNKVWRDAKRALDHEGVKFSGLRVVEPHHDGCPHWHMLAFTAPEHGERLIETLRTYALRDSPDESGAAEHRFKVERVDPAKGSAVGYIAKYIAKNIDGEGVDFDDETGATGRDAARRIVPWARLWGIRQFQFFGLPPITPTRELYRVERVTSPSQSLQAAHRATKANDYGAWLHVFDAFALNFQATYTERGSDRYAEETTRRIQGLIARANDLSAPARITTRVDEWRIQPRREEAASALPAPPWTRFNNCAHVDFKGVFPASIEVEDLATSEKRVGRREGVPRRAPLPSEGRADWRSSGRNHRDRFDLRKKVATRPAPASLHA